MCGHVHSLTCVPCQRTITIGKQILAGVKGRVRSNYIEDLKLVGSVQRGSNTDQNVKFNHCKKTGSSGVKGRLATNLPIPGLQQ